MDNSIRSSTMMQPVPGRIVEVIAHPGWLASRATLGFEMQRRWRRVWSHSAELANDQ